MGASWESRAVARVSQRREFDRWGNQTLQTGTVADTNRLRWKALLWEGDSTQLYYMRNRWYDPSTGRFVSQDPDAPADDGNQYDFGGADHLSANDPFGTNPFNYLYPFENPDCRGFPCVPGGSETFLPSQGQQSGGFIGSDTCATLRQKIKTVLDSFKKHKRDFDFYNSGQRGADHGHWVATTNDKKGLNNRINDYKNNFCDDDNNSDHQQFAPTWADALKWAGAPVSPPKLRLPGYDYPPVSSITAPDMTAVRKAAPAVGVLAAIVGTAILVGRVASVAASVP